MLLLFSAVFVLLEQYLPYYFLQDDAYNGLFPMLVYNFKTLFSGYIPFYNPHQYLGMPLLSAGQYAVLYPPAYIALGLSKAVLGHFYAGLDILMYLHLACGLLGFFALMRALGLGRAASAFGALGWLLNGAVIFLGSSWASIGVTAAYFPWMLLYGLKSLEYGGRRAFAMLQLWRLLFVYFGHMQFFVYAALFEALVAGLRLLQLRGDGNVSVRAARYAASWGFTLVFSLPQLMPNWMHVQLSGVRSQQLPYEIFRLWPIKPLLWAWGLVWPFYPPSSALFVSGANFYDSFTPYFSHIGYVPLALLFLWVRPGADGRLRQLRLAALGFAVLVFLWGSGALSPLLYHVPLFNRFRYPMKLLPFLNFFLLTLAAVNLQSVLELPRLREKARETAVAALSFLVLGFVFLYEVSPRRNFYVNLDRPPLEETRSDLLSQGRVMSFGEHEGRGEGRAYGVAGYNFATLGGLYHLAGYDPLVPLQTALKTAWLNYSSILALQPRDLQKQVEYWRGWGVRWYLVKPEQSSEYGPWLEKCGLVRRFEDQTRTVFEDSAAKPMACVVGEDGCKALEYEIKPDGISLRWDRPYAGVVEANFICLPFFRAYADGARIDVMKSPDGRLAALAPAGARKIEFRYADQLFYCGLAMVAAALVLCVLPSARKKIIELCGLAAE